MPSLNERQTKLIRRLLAGECPSIRELAASSSVSERSIRTDLARIEGFLDQYGISLRKASGGGFCVEASTEQSALVLSSNKLNQPTGQKRALLIALRLLMLGSSTYGALSIEFGVSRSTLMRLFPSVEGKLSPYGVSIRKERGRGVSIAGDEEAIREAFVRLLDQACSDSQPRFDAFPIDDVACECADKVVAESARLLNVRYYDPLRLRLKLAFCLHRISAGYSLIRESLPEQIRRVADDRGFPSYAGAVADLSLDDADRLFIIWILMGSSKESLGDGIGEDAVATKIAEFLMRKLQRLHPLAEVDERRFRKGLISHLNVALYRIRNRISLQNKMLDQVKLSIPLIFEYTKEQLAICGEMHGVPFDEDEVAYIAMYAGSIYETSAKFDNRITILMTCEFGMTTSSILDSRMRQLVPECKLIGPLPRSEAIEYVASNPVDLVISTGSLDLGGVKTIQVNPLLQRHDIDAIKSALYQLSYTKTCKGFMESHRAAEDSRKPRLALGSFIRREDIQIVDFAVDWQFAISKASEPLLADGRIEKRYTDRMISAVKEYGTYMVLTEGTAFVHAGTEDGINSNCTALLVMRRPVMFGDDAMKMVRNIVVIGIKTVSGFSLLELARIFASEDNQKRLRARNIDIDTICALR